MNKDALPSNNKMLVAAEALLLSAQSDRRQNYPTICRYISQFENCCRDKGYSYTDIDNARFFLCAFLDELAPQNKSFVVTYFDASINKDTEFFERLARLQLDVNKYIDVLELAYYCLSLGFRGQFSQPSSNNELINITDTLYHQIRDVRDITQPLTIGKHETTQPSLWRCPPIWLTVIIALAILISIFIPYNQKLNQYIKPALDAIQSLTPTDYSND